MYLPSDLKNKSNQELFNLLLKNKNQLDKKSIEYIKDEIISRGLSFDEIRKLTGTTKSNSKSQAKKKTLIYLPLQIAFAIISFNKGIELLLSNNKIEDVNYVSILIFILAVTSLIGLSKRNKSGWYISLILLITYVTDYLITIGSILLSDKEGISDSNEVNLIFFLITGVVIAFNSFYIYYLNTQNSLMRFGTDKSDLSKVILFSVLLILLKNWT